ncbi:MAG: hypothetical protein RJB13_2556 [Pseudomonadota bacterium]
MDNTHAQYGLFAVANATSHELTYLLPKHISERVVIGSLCEVPLQGRTAVGVFLGMTEEPSFSCRPVTEVIPECPEIRPNIITLLKWVANYYLAPLGRTIHLAGPGFLWKAGSHEKRLKRKPKRLKSSASQVEATPVKTLSQEQSTALAEIVSVQSGKTVLLHGVTGSGKTEIYLHLVQKTLNEGGAALVLLPEIALTPQMCERFRVHFPHQLAVLHSGLSPLEYEKEWFRVARGEARLVLGVRSAVFAPLSQLKLIIVDEEHEGSYKCDEFPCYQARDCAVKRAQLEQALCILGSATPSLESYLNAEQDKYKKIMLSVKHSRQQNRIELFQYRPNIHSTGGARGVVRSSQFSFSGHVIAPGVIDLISAARDRGEQSMVILNRRGFAQFAICADCGTALQCPHCSVSTTLHERGHKELCHYCGFSRPILKNCAACGSEKLISMGLGTQNTEQEIADRIPGIRVDRLDRDVLTSQTRLKQIIEKFKNGDTDCLVGTQMLSKGHDFSKVTLVVVLNIEDGLFIPDFRAAERTFQLLCQASGRSGRGDLAGVTAVQSLGANHALVSQALNAEVNHFLSDEINMRRLGWHPPICRQILIELHHGNEARLMYVGHRIQSELTKAWEAQGFTPKHVRLTGPMPAVLSKLKGQHRVHLVISAQRDIHPSRLVSQEVLQMREFQGIIKVDVDPFSFL